MWQSPAIPTPAGGKAAWAASVAMAEAPHSELRAFYAYVSPREAEIQARRAAIEDVQSALRYNSPWPLSVTRSCTPPALPPSRPTTSHPGAAVDQLNTSQKKT